MKVKSADRVPISFHVDKALKDELQKAAARGFRPMSKEIEMRLKRSVLADEKDKEVHQ